MRLLIQIQQRDRRDAVGRNTRIGIRGQSSQLEIGLDRDTGIYEEHRDILCDVHDVLDVQLMILDQIDRRML